MSNFENFTPALHSKWRHTKGTIYEVIMLSNDTITEDDPDFPKMITYTNSKGEKYTQPLKRFLTSGKYVPMIGETPPSMEERMIELVEMDLDSVHIEADNILCEKLIALGESQLVTIYQTLHKSY